MTERVRRGESLLTAAAAAPPARVMETGTAGVISNLEICDGEGEKGRVSADSCRSCAPSQGDGDGDSLLVVHHHFNRLQQVDSSLDNAKIHVQSKAPGSEYTYPRRNSRAHASAINTSSMHGTPVSYTVR